MTDIMTDHEIKSPRRKPKRQRKTSTHIVLAIIGLFVIWLLGTSIWQVVQSRLVNIEFLTPGSVSQTVSVNGILIKEETVLLAPVKGQLKMISSEGERVRSGGLVARIVADGNQSQTGQPVAAPRPGVVCTHLDRLENILRPGIIDALELNEVQKLQADTSLRDGGALVEKGQPVAKLVDNLAPVWLWFFMKGNWPASKSLARGDYINMSWQGNQLRGRLEEIRQREEGQELFFSLNRYPDALLHERNVELQLVTGKLSGFLVPQGAIIEKEGQTGIYVILEKRVKWLPVEIHGQLSDKIAVTGPELGAETRYVTNPHWVRVGNRVE